MVLHLEDDSKVWRREGLLVADQWELYFEANRIPEYKIHRAIKALKGNASIQRLGGNDTIQMQNGGTSQKFYYQRGSSFPPLNYFLFILAKFLNDLLT